METAELERLTTAISILTQCDGCTGCCTDMGTGATLSVVDSPMLYDEPTSETLDDKRRHLRIFGQSQACGFLNRKTHHCEIHHSRKLPVRAPRICSLYPFYLTVDDEFVVVGTCLHIGDMLLRIGRKEPKALAALDVVFELLPKFTPDDLRLEPEEYADWRFAIVLQPPHRAEDSIGSTPSPA